MSGNTRCCLATIASAATARTIKPTNTQAITATTVHPLVLLAADSPGCRAAIAPTGIGGLGTGLVVPPGGIAPACDDGGDEGLAGDEVLEVVGAFGVDGRVGVVGCVVGAADDGVFGNGDGTFSLPRSVVLLPGAGPFSSPVPAVPPPAAPPPPPPAPPAPPPTAPPLPPDSALVVEVAVWVGEEVELSTAKDGPRPTQLMNKARMIAIVTNSSVTFLVLDLFDPSAMIKR